MDKNNYNKAQHSPVVPDIMFNDLSNTQNSLKSIQPPIKRETEAANLSENNWDGSFEDNSFLDLVENKKNGEDSLVFLQDRTTFDVGGTFNDLENVSLPVLGASPEKDEGGLGIIEPLVNMIWYWLDQEMYNSALFAAERLVYHDKSAARPWFLLALAYYRADKVKQAQMILNNLPGSLMDHNSIFLLGKISLKLKDFKTAEESFRNLLGRPLPKIQTDYRSAHLKRCYRPDKCSVLIFLADTLRMTFRNEEALGLYEEAWTINPFSWKPFEDMCHIATKPPSAELIESMFYPNKRNADSAQLATPGNQGFKRHNSVQSREGQVPEILVFTPSQDRVLPSNYSISSVAHNPPANQDFTESNPKVDEMSGTAHGPSSRILGPDSYDESVFKKPFSNEIRLPKMTSEARGKGLNGLFIQFNICQSLLTKTDTAASLAALSALPESQSKSPWVQCARGRAYFEATDYDKAREAFTGAASEAPYSTSSLDVFSTTLWHLKDAPALNGLVADLEELSPLGYETLLATGNVYSLQGWSKRATRVFEETIELYPLANHAFTLAGHEFRSIKQDDLAANMFRAALRVCPRNHSAWFGLGCISQDRGDHEKVLNCFKKALNIAPKNVILQEKCADAYVKVGDLNSALDLINSALENAISKNVLNFQKARVLMAQENYHEALYILKGLHQQYIMESSLHLTLGKLYLLMDNPADARIHLQWAADLTPTISEKVEHLMELSKQGGALKDIDSLTRFVFEMEDISFRDF